MDGLINPLINGEISGSHGGEYEDGCPSWP
jgi:hypothetical protein